jgi:hypothetical protein
MTHSFDSAGNLVISVDSQEQAEIKSRMTEDGFDSDDIMHEILEPLVCNSEVQYCSPEEVGALTDAPMLCVHGTEDEIESVWAFMDYQVRSVQADLAEYGRAVFVSGN